MKKQGATLVDPVEFATSGKYEKTEFLGFMYELKADLNAYLAWLGPNTPVKTLKEIIEFNEKNASKEMPYFGQENFLKAEEKGPLTTPEYIEAIKKNHELTGKEGIDATMDKHKLDAIVGADGRAGLADGHREWRRVWRREFGVSRRCRDIRILRWWRDLILDCRWGFRSSGGLGASRCC